MQQLLLDVFTPPKPSLHNFLVGQNGELMHHLHALASGSTHEPRLGIGSAPVIYLYGPSGCGKTHLLQSLADAITASNAAHALHTNHAAVSCVSGKQRFVFKPKQTALASNTPIKPSGQGHAAPSPFLPLLLDDVEHLTDYSQIQCFNAINACLHEKNPPCVVLTGESHPMSLQLREDLRTRIAAGLCFKVQPLSDEEKQTALNRLAIARGLTLSEDVVDYALKYFQRDMGSLTAVMDGLDRFSLEQQKPVNVHLLRNWMRRRESLVVREHAVHS